MLQWARESGCDWNWQTCRGAADSGRLPVLRWARANGAAWDSQTCAAAAAGGHLAILQVAPHTMRLEFSAAPSRKYSIFPFELPKTTVAIAPTRRIYHHRDHYV